MKVKSVKRIILDSPVPVYDLTVNGTENFCLGNGIVVHNSKDCISGDTLIPLLSGESIPIRILADRRRKVAKDKIWVYSSLPNGKMVPAMASDIHKVGRRKTVKVLLDSGEYLVCTPDHRIMMRDGNYLPAEKLRPGMSLMPIYKKISVANSRTALNGYEQFLDNHSQKWKFTHQYVGEVSLGFTYGASKDGRKVLHHKDFNKRNNRPDNIDVMGWNEHRDYHNKIGTINLRMLNNDPEFCRRRAIRAAKLGKKTGKKNITKYNKSAARILKLKESGLFSRNGSSVMKSLWADPQYRANQSIRVRERSIRKDITLDRIFSTAKICYSINHLSEELGCNKKVVYRVLREGKINPSQIRRNFIEGVNPRTCVPRPRAGTRNHSVVSVTPYRACDVYDMTVDRIHNFAIGPGIFVHNCADAVAGTVFHIVRNVSMHRPGIITARSIGPATPSKSDSSVQTAPSVIDAARARYSRAGFKVSV